MIDKALDIAARPEVIFCSFGDMLRVPGSATDLLAVKAGGGDVRIVYSPMDAVKLAGAKPRQRGGVLRAWDLKRPPRPPRWLSPGRAQKGLKNFSMLVSHVLVPPAIEALLARRTAACRASWPPATSAPSWVTRSISRLPPNTGCRSW